MSRRSAGKTAITMRGGATRIRMAQSTRGKNNPPNHSAEWVEMDVPSRLPIIPLVSSVLFPGGVLSLQVGICFDHQVVP